MLPAFRLRVEYRVWNLEYNIGLLGFTVEYECLV